MCRGLVMPGATAWLYAPYQILVLKHVRNTELQLSFKSKSDPTILFQKPIQTKNRQFKISNPSKSKILSLLSDHMIYKI